MGGAGNQSHGIDRAVAIGGALTALGVGLGALTCWFLHAAGYFFLFDDYALVGQAGRTSRGDIFREPLFGFCRPFVFTATKALAS